MADTYYTSRYSGEDIDNAVDKVNDTSAGNDALKAALDARTHDLFQQLGADRRL